MPAYDAFLLLSFGGPEGPDDVLPFLENVTRGRGVPAQRLAEVAGHYQARGGVSPINGQCRDLLKAVGAAFAADGIDLPLYWGNRNWHPFIEDTVRQMRADGVERAVAFVTSAYSSYSACRQYLDDIDRAVAAVGAGAPRIDKIRPYFNHPGFIEPFAASVEAALAGLPAEAQAGARLVFTAHSVPRRHGRRERQRVHRHGGPRCCRRQVRGRAAGSLETYLRTGAGRLPPLRPRLPEPQRPAERALAGAGRERPPGGAGQGGAAGRALLPAARRPASSWCRSASSATTWRSCTTWTWRPPGPRRRSASPSRGPRRPARPRGSPRWSASSSRSVLSGAEPRALGRFGPRVYEAGAFAGGAESCPADCCRYAPDAPRTSRVSGVSGRKGAAVPGRRSGASWAPWGERGPQHERA